MNDELFFQEMAEAGYLLLEPLHPASPGGTRLLIALRQTPTERHYDPERIDLSRADADGCAGRVRLTLAALTSGNWPLCPGPVVLRDRFDKRVYFFSYGGALEIYTNAGMAVCVLTSPAPIVEMANEPDNVAEQLASETEALLARMHANWGRDDQGYQQRLVEIDPLELYAATIIHLLESYKQNSALRHSFHRFYGMLLNEQDWLQGLERPHISSIPLDVLLAPAGSDPASSSS
ncbi:MAG: hypothetical protein H6632_22770 [Anaerolineales bacterium]|nr:hypothetical protein [Anaerolineales bacterium]